MKHLAFAVFISLVFGYSNAQNVSSDIVVNPLILEFYPATKVDIILKENPNKIKYWNAIYEHGFEIRKVKKTELEATKDYDEIEINDFKKVNILQMNLFPKKESTQYFRIKNSEKILVLFSEQIIINKLTKEK